MDHQPARLGQKLRLPPLGLAGFPPKLTRPISNCLLDGTAIIHGVAPLYLQIYRAASFKDTTGTIRNRIKPRRRAAASLMSLPWSFSILPTDSQGCEKTPPEKTVNFISFNLFLARTVAEHPRPTQGIKKNRNAKLTI
jgi:hypothetical protein